MFDSLSVGIIGTGRVGQALAFGLNQNTGCRVLAWNRSRNVLKSFRTLLPAIEPPQDRRQRQRGRDAHHLREGAHRVREAVAAPPPQGLLDPVGQNGDRQRNAQQQRSVAAVGRERSGQRMAPAGGFRSMGLGRHS